ncbi:MAG: RluA family pseudouridine synthase [Spirochaetaceae bacterium]|jgi:23S rRNA pseudouridine1911/1915/1917 synthase|nr:RluA family pseudouridine synthase [Spirochaetaceae bacterium]
MPSISCTVQENLPEHTRLDKYAAEHLKVLSRSQLKARLLTAQVNGKIVKISQILKTGDRVCLVWRDPDPPDIIPQDLPLSIIYEDQLVAVINKAQGMIVHPGAGNPTGTLANALLFRRNGFAAGNPTRPGIVHRLDKDTSGVIIAAYANETLRFLAEQFKNREVRKTYLAVVRGAPPNSAGRIATRIARDPTDRKRFAVSADKGKTAVTLYRVLGAGRRESLVLLRPKTGRTHQLRVHLRHIGCPIVGDPIYGKTEGYTLMLHALRLAIRLPGDPNPKTFTAPVPPRFKVFSYLFPKR